MFKLYRQVLGWGFLGESCERGQKLIEKELFGGVGRVERGGKLWFQNYKDAVENVDDVTRLELDWGVNEHVN